MREKGRVVVVVGLIFIVNIIGVFGIPRPKGIHKRKVDDEDKSLEVDETENEIDDIISGIVQLMEKERLPNDDPSKSTKANHEESTQNKVISHGMLVPIKALTIETNESNPGNIVTPLNDDTLVLAQIGLVSEIDNETDHAGKTDESDSENTETGNINSEEDRMNATPEMISNKTKNMLITTSSTLDMESKLITTSTSIKTTAKITSETSTTTTTSTTSTTSSSTISTTTTSTTTLSTTESTTSTKASETLTATDNEEDRRELCDAIPNNSILRNGLGSTGFTWPGGKIPYQIGDGFNTSQRSTIQSAIDYYNLEFQGCLEWVAKGSESNYVTFENTGTCSSRIGVAFYPFPVSQSIYLGRCSHLEGHIKHEMMHTIGFYHEHSRSDRDMYIKILWNNIPPSYHAQFNTYRWTTGYGEKYDYESIMHYSSRAFVKDYNDKGMKSILPTDESVDVDNLGFKPNLSETDIKKIKKMYKCDPYKEYKATCSNDDNCGVNEYCALFVGECRTQLPPGSLCVLDRECLNYCGGGVCSVCEEDAHCGEAEYCTYKYLPGIEKECSGYCGGLCLLSSQCGGECGTCGWSFQCQ